MKIIKYNKNLENNYNNFLNSMKNSMFYHSLKYKFFLEKLLNVESDYFILWDNYKIKGVLPLFYKDGKYGRIYNSLPFYGSNGGIIATDTNSANILIEKYLEIVRNDNIAGSTLIETPIANIDYSNLIFNESDYRIGQWTELDYKENIEESIMNSFESSARRNVRKAIKENVTVEIDNTQIDFLYETHYENITSIGGKAKNKNFFELIDKHFVKEKDYNIYIAKLGDKTIGALLLFYFKDTVEYFTPAIVNEYRNLQALPLIIYQAMVDSSKNGYKNWNWGGTWITQEGVMKFKRKFGAVDKKYKYFIKINNQDIYNSSKEELLSEYDNFYVIPFDKLKG